MKRQHQLLFGKDVISALVVDRTFYRAQVEHDLRAKLLRLRQKASGMLSEAGPAAPAAAGFRFDVLRAVPARADPGRRRRAGQKARGDGRRQPAFRISIPLPFEKLLDIREQRLKARDVEPVALLDSYLQGISAVIDRCRSAGEIGDDT